MHSPPIMHSVEAKEVIELVDGPAIRSLILKGEKFDLESGHYDFRAVWDWLHESYEALAPFPKEQEEFSRYCFGAAFPKDRVEWGIEILKKTLLKSTPPSEEMIGEQGEYCLYPPVS